MTERPCIMIADDDIEIRRMVSRALELEGFEVAIASDGKSALTLLKKSNPVLAILDIMMPGLTGFEVVESIRQTSQIPVIMLTARSEVASLKKALSLGADDYVTKPFNIQILIARVRAKLRRSSTENSSST